MEQVTDAVEFARLCARAERARVAHNAIPRWHRLRRIDAARVYRYALLDAALAELRLPPGEIPA